MMMIDVMQTFYDINANGCHPQILNDIYINAILNKYCNDGMALVTAMCTDVEVRTNIENTKLLITDMQKAGIRYIPVYGGYHDKGVDIAEGYEPSFIITNHNREGDVLNFDTLKEFAINMCGKYNQESVMVKDAFNVPCFYDENCGVAEIVSPTQEYFARLFTTSNQTGITKGNMVFDCYVNPCPCTLNERRYRDMRGEVILGRWHNGKFLFE